MQTYAILSDIHSNVYALRAVVEHAKRLGINKFINLGDILYGPIAPQQTFEYLQSLNTITICGNQDRQIFQATQNDIDANPTMQFIWQQLSQEAMAWMQALPFDYQISDDIYVCHGTPSDDLEYLLEDASHGHAQLRDDQSILDRLDGQTSAIILCGHTHTPRCVTLSTGQVVINPGSVGMPAYTDDEPFLHSMENYSPHARYATLTLNAEQQWDVAFHCVDYDVASAVEQALRRERNDWAHFLTTGRGLSS
ncbi:metallophosphoesterase family protein [Vibrio scophthalmi]|uniref:Ser/Thr protein phosphatase family protein n=1 Tax=Vibrio scophthalmi LMG 19158 TaxID=870967 RepID=F9RSA5_9VIBR|nr:metallophosphoesterase family protein [Vibrio scophthalmi]EGU32431.1 Ser/Thr protein phosphatase family protein [Vibrio scophthalmi LMG 19158]